MLPLKNRLLTRKDFEEVKEKGQKFQSHFFGLLISPTNYDQTRFGFIISTRLSKKATERNHVRRVLRESVHKFLPEVKPGFNVVFLGKREILNKSYQEVLKEVERTFKQSGLI